MSEKSLDTPVVPRRIVLNMQLPGCLDNKGMTFQHRATGLSRFFLPVTLWKQSAPYPGTQIGLREFRRVSEG